MEKPPRDARYARLEERDVQHFRSIVADPQASVVTDPDALAPLNEDWLHKYRGYSKLGLQPRTVEEVARILKYCNERRLAVVPQGGNTGLVGGSVPVHDEIILSMSKMNKVLSFDPVSGVLTCEAGCVLQTLDEYLEQNGFTMPLDLGAKGSCHIGGNVATNAGGVRFLRYGSLHGNVLGLQVVLPDGTILDSLNGLRKDNTGYDLKQLFIGSEGSLGVITAVSLLTPARPKSVNVAVLSVPSFEAVQKAFVEVKQDLGEILSAFEFWDRQSMELEMQQLPHIRDPLSSPSPFYILVETHGSNEAHDTEKLNGFLERAMGEGLVTDGTVAQDTTQFRALWNIRESFAEAGSKAGFNYKYDLSIPINKMYDLATEVRERLGNKAQTIAYGHVGDSNLHLNMVTPKYDAEVHGLIEPFVYEWTSKQGGSISAEHGLGLMKRDCLHYSKPEQAIRYMRVIKETFDPQLILNPYKVIPLQ